MLLLKTINRTRENGGRIIAVGTTSCRVLETVAARMKGSIKPAEGWTDIFIYPGYQIQNSGCFGNKFSSCLSPH